MGAYQRRTDAPGELIEKHFESIEELILNNLLIISHDIHKTYTSPSTAYIKGEILFADGTSLAIFEHIRIIETEVIITDYRYHYMTENNQMIFRYDNAPHRFEIETFPHHKHIMSDVYNTNMPDIKDVMKEAEQMMIKKIT